MKHLKNFKNYITENTQTDDPVETEIYNTIEMMMRPGDDTLSFSEINDIANENGVDEEKVLWIMNRYLMDRAEEYKDELKNEIEYYLKELSEERKENINWTEFKNEFLDDLKDGLVLDYTDEKIKEEFEKQTLDPNQLDLPF